MSNRLYSGLGYSRLISLLALAGIFTNLSAQAACYKTPHSAIDSLQTNASVSAASESSGYRVTGIQFDPILGKRWVMISSCNHPEWPAVALQAAGTTLATNPLDGKRPLIEDVRQTPVI